jgi:hypothetical protein
MYINHYSEVVIFKGKSKRDSGMRLETVFAVKIISFQCCPIDKVRSRKLLKMNYVLSASYKLQKYKETFSVCSEVVHSCII